MKLVDEYLEQVPNSALYHYTNACGLIGILKSKSIWASSIHHLNDTQEYKHAVGMMSEELEKRFRKIESSSGLEQLYGTTQTPSSHSIDSLSLLRENLEGLKETPLYIASFSEHKDVLSQWRGYCKEGDGYSIGFMPQTLTCLQSGGFQLVKCVYSQEDQRVLCNALIDSYLQLDAKFVGKRTLWRHGSKSEWRSKFSVLAAAIKHLGFEEEAEWRLIGKEDDENAPHFRSGRSGVVPYLVVPIVTGDENVPVAELVIGPTDDKEASLIGAQKIMERYARKNLANRLFPSRSPEEPLRIASPGLVDYLITPSATPYRN
jgi:hypothetical protein